MPMPLGGSRQVSFPKPQYLTFENWKRGVISLIDKSRLPKDALETADNIFLYEDGQPGPRPGVGYFGAVMPNAAAIDGYDYFDFNGVVHLVAVAGGVVYRSTNDGTTWTACTGATPTSGVTMNFNQNGSYLYLTNGVDNIIRYDGSTTLATYTALTTPAAPTAALTGLAGTSFTYYYKIAAVNTVGFSVASAKLTQTVGRQRSGWDTTSNYVTLTLPTPQATQTRADIYISENDLDYYYLDSIISSTAVPGVTYKDDGTAIIAPGTLAPTANTTQGPKYAELINIGSRQYGFRDPSNRYRIGFTGTDTYSGAFASAYDGGYLDWQPGGKFIPVMGQDYRDGKGTPTATIWCSSADGLGCILQMSLETLTIGDISITVPSAYKLPGSRGTNSPGSVVNVLNDFMFYNSQAIYNIGNKVNLQQIISTDEKTANIRKEVKSISAAGEAGIATTYFDARVYFSVPVDSTANNVTMIFDTEHQAWLPRAFTIGFKKFLKYTDTSSSRHLLALKPGDNRLSEISSAIQGDYGVAFETDLITGLYPTTKNRFDFQFTEEAEIELSNPQGTFDIELIGIDRTVGYATIVSKSISTDGTVLTGWDSSLWDTLIEDYTADVTPAFSESSVKRYFNVQKELNAVQWRIKTEGIGDRYILRTLQTWGTETQAGKPREWRL
jgi:hypothetical protein